TRVGRDAVVVPQAQRAPVHALGIAVFGEAEMEVGVEPAVVGLAQLGERSEFDHGFTSCRQNGAAPLGIKFPIGNGAVVGGRPWSFYVDPGRRMIARALRTAHRAVDAAFSQPMLKRRGEEKMIDAQPGIALPTP